ncbi:MAG: hypothetical protein ACD_50C00146G0003 [uncultured bacterium]|nr:MAG: hypothetical protein ACD_50C00146G0003 [uncultured bacterium]KKR15699.1 MAG: Tfp pilus assembly protein [Candidatus Levybacteria bacterium GW2011_GWA1_39_34]KKR50145.1 MAG: Tfp pilus assembly protein [Candidatus Levybacteria bacterium GW2011_GWC1_40_19]KKR94991.1 MAG: Tfp pilus assembly protein [Candidatus Levybacteria bacterium GW2011_GWA2_41_15]KKS01207.1 MAG: Tfp pilus assembly protein [Candidatus Levybacteria bacterium GW2011_GWB1_41_21]OGH21060.1 MAG: hypothetical protein A2695_01
MRLPKLKPRVLNNGFTLIELIVVISVISILATIGIVSFVNYDRTQQLSGSVSNVVNLLNQAKSNSLSQVKPKASCSQPAVLDGYEVEVDGSNSKLTLSARCSSGDGTDLTEEMITSITLPTNIKISSVIASDGTETFFYPLFSKTVNGGSICLLGYGLDEKLITLSNLGIVTVKSGC